MEIIIGILILAAAIFLANLKKSGTSNSGASPPKNQPAPKNKEEFILPLADGDVIDEVILDEKDL